MTKACITGACGFVGYHLIKQLLADNPEVQITAVDNLQRGKLDREFKLLCDSGRVTFYRMNLCDDYVYRVLGTGYDQIYHLAAVNGTRNFYEKPHEVLRTNTLSTIHVLDWFRQKNPQAKFCFTSSNEAYAGGLNAFGQLPIPTPEAVPLVIEDPYNPRWSYASTKLIGECFVIHYCQQYKLKGLIVRPHNVFGERAGFEHVIPEFCVRIAKRIDPFPINGADDTRTFLYIGDCIKAILLLMNSPKTDNNPIETVQIGDYGEMTIRDLAERMFEVSGWHPNQLDIKASPFGSVKRRLADVTKLREMTGWKPEVSLEDGLRRTYEWYERNCK